MCIRDSDDNALLGDSKRNLQCKINCLETYCDENYLIVNLKKTKVMVIRRGGKVSKKHVFYYKNEPIEIVSNYTYLGVLFSSSGRFFNACNSFITKSIAAN